MSDRYACARHAREAGEPVHATASQVRRWLLLEQDGPWGRDAVLESRIEPTTARALKALASRLGARLILIRRHGGGRDGQGHRVIAAVSALEGSAAEAFTVRTPADVLDLDLSLLDAGEAGGGAPVSAPLYLVCTNGRHDACCAEYGRPLARALAASHPAQTWECSHIGGDRFAGNLVCLPEGVYYGHVGPLDAPRVVRAHRDGRVDLGHYRGRSCLAFVVQAAEHFVRRDLALDGLGDVMLEQHDAVGPTAHRVAFRLADGRRALADVQVSSDPEPRWLTCQAPRAGAPPRYVLTGLHVDVPSSP